MADTKRNWRLAFWISITALISCGSACSVYCSGWDDEPTSEQIQQVSDDSIAVTLFRMNAGATVAFFYRVHVHEAQDAPSHKQAQFMLYGVFEPSLTLEEDLLIIDFQANRPTQFNRGPESVSIGQRTLTVEMREDGIKQDPIAPD
jgi:hypothetical protein